MRSRSWTRLSTRPSGGDEHPVYCTNTFIDEYIYRYEYINRKQIEHLTLGSYSPILRRSEYPQRGGLLQMAAKRKAPTRGALSWRPTIAEDPPPRILRRGSSAEDPQRAVCGPARSLPTRARAAATVARSRNAAVRRRRQVPTTLHASVHCRSKFRSSRRCANGCASAQVSPGNEGISGTC